MRHAVECLRARTLSSPAPAAPRSVAALRKEVLAAPDRALEDIIGFPVAIKTKKPKYPAGAATDDVQLLVRRNKVVGEQLRRPVRVREQFIIGEALRCNCKRIDNRAEPNGTTSSEQARQARRGRASQLLSKARNAGERKLFRGVAPRYGRVGGQKDGNAAAAVIKVRSQTDEL